MVEYFLQGGAFMYPILGFLIVGLAITFERLYTLTMSSINTKRFLKEVNAALDSGGVDKAIELCNKTRGPVAEIFHAGLTRIDRGLDEVEKAIQNAGTLEMAFLEKNMIWMNAVITVAPMLGFTGTVVGMIKAFNDIKAQNDISPNIVADGISIALLTTAFGLIVAIVIQLFQNFFVSRIDKLVLDMEENSVLLIDRIAEIERKNKQ